MESYDSKTGLHHVKYADRDRADISMRHEAVVLLPNDEVRGYRISRNTTRFPYLRCTQRRGTPTAYKFGLEVP